MINQGVNTMIGQYDPYMSSVDRDSARRRVMIRDEMANVGDAPVSVGFLEKMENYSARTHNAISALEETLGILADRLGVKQPGYGLAGATNADAPPPVTERLCRQAEQAVQSLDRVCQLAQSISRAL